MAAYVPDRGDIVWLDFSPQRGHEQAGLRPALVLSSKSYNHKSGLMLACPITSKIKSYPFEVRVKAATIDGVIIADQIKSLDWRDRKPSYITKATSEVLSRTKGVVELLLQG